MELFHLTVLTIASIIFIISLATIGVVMRKGSQSGTFPPFASNCPDGWYNISGRPSPSNITGTISGTILTPSVGTTTIPNGTFIVGNGIPDGTKVISETTPNGTYNISNATTFSGNLSLIAPNMDDKTWYTCIAPTNINATTTGIITWDNAGRHISYDDSTTSICEKRKWTMSNNIVWDGVSNYNSC